MRAASIFKTALALLAAAISPSLFGQSPPIADFTSLPDFHTPTLSPDGAHIALVSPSQKNFDILNILDAETLEVKAGFRTPRHDRIDNYWWVNEERIVISTSTDRWAGTDWYPTGSLYAYNVDGSRNIQIAGPRFGEDENYQLLDALKQDRDHILVVRTGYARVSRNPQWDVFSLDVYKHADQQILGTPLLSVPTDLPFKELANEQGGDFDPASIFSSHMLVDHDGNIGLATFWAGPLLTVKTALSQAGKWEDISHLVGVDFNTANSGGEMRRLLSNLRFPLAFNSDDTGLYHVNQSSNGRFSLALLDLASHNSTTIYAHEKYDLPLGNPIKSADGRELIGITLPVGRLERHYFSDHPDTLLYKSIDKSFPEHEVEFINFSDDMRKGLAWVSSSTTPPSLFLLDRDKGEFTSLFSTRAKLQSLSMTPAELISYEARDGTRIEGYLTKAVGVEGPAPMLVLIQNLLSAGFASPRFDPEVKLLTSRGYSVLQLNVRGSFGYGIDFWLAGFGNWGTTVVDDIVDGTEYVISNGWADPSRICAVGRGIGGHAAMMAIARYPDRYKCGVSMSGTLYDWAHGYSDSVASGELEEALESGEVDESTIRLFEDLFGDLATLETNSPVALAGNIKVPVLLAHTGSDPYEFPGDTRRFRKALEDAGVEYEWFFQRHANENALRPEHKEKYYKKLFEFLGKNL